MRRTWFLLLILFLAGMGPLTAQEDGGEGDDGGNVSPPIESDWDIYRPELYRRGDQTFNINLGLLIPMKFTGSGMKEAINKDNPSNLHWGGTGFLAYNYFLSAHWFLGGELGMMFAQTGGENMLFMVPFGLRFGYQFILSRFEFPLTLMVGGMPKKYLEKDHFGLIVKPGASGYFRFNPDWSFGLNVQWWMAPEWPRNGKDVFGNFLELTLSARYHF